MWLPLESKLKSLKIAMVVLLILCKFKITEKPLSSNKKQYLVYFYVGTPVVPVWNKMQSLPHRYHNLKHFSLRKKNPQNDFYTPWRTGHHDLERGRLRCLVDVQLIAVFNFIHSGKTWQLLSHFCVKMEFFRVSSLNRPPLQLNFLKFEQTSHTFSCNSVVRVGGDSVYLMWCWLFSSPLCIAQDTTSASVSSILGLGGSQVDLMWDSWKVQMNGNFDHLKVICLSLAKCPAYSD